MKIELFGQDVEFQEVGPNSHGTTRYQSVFRGVVFVLKVGVKKARIAAHIVHGHWIEHDDKTPQQAADRFMAQIRTLKTLLEALTAPKVNPG